MNKCDILREKRLKLGLSLKYVASRIGVTFQHLADVETGKRRLTTERREQIEFVLNSDISRKIHPNLREDIGSFIREKREKANLPIAQIASETMISCHHIRAMERGVKRYTTDTIYKIIGILDIPEADILQED